MIESSVSTKLIERLRKQVADTTTRHDGVITVINAPPCSCGECHACEAQVMFEALDEALDALILMQKALDSTMPGVKYIAVQDYALLNDAPCAAKTILLKAGRK